MDDLDEEIKSLNTKDSENNEGNDQSSINLKKRNIKSDQGDEDFSEIEIKIKEELNKD